MTATTPAAGPPRPPAGPRRPAAGRLRPADLARVASVGLRTRKLRAALSATGQEVLALLAQLNAYGVTIVLITHDRGIAARAPRQIDMLDGRIVTDTARVTPAIPGGGAPAGRLARLPGPAQGGTR